VSPLASVTDPWSFRSLIPLVLAMLTSTAFLSVVPGSFLNWDDDVNFQHNTAYRGLGPRQIWWAFTSILFGHYTPLTRLTFSLNYVLGGLEPWGYHLLNVLLHGGNAGLFYVVARRLLAAAVDGGRQERRSDLAVCVAAAFAALFFGVHPLRVEPVAWVTGRADLLCATFVLLAAGAYLRAVEHDNPARSRLVLVSTAWLGGRSCPREPHSQSWRRCSWTSTRFAACRASAGPPCWGRRLPCCW
jgi:hypothetical protein